MNTESSGSSVRPVMIALFFGVLAGVACTLLLPRWLGPRVPARFRGGERVEGVVLDKTLDGDRLLLKVQAGDEIYLSTFLERWKEVDFLIEPHDMVTLVVSGGDPFLENPPIEKVRRPGQGGTQPLHGDVAPKRSAPPDASWFEPEPAGAESLHQGSAADSGSHDNQDD